MIGSLPRLFLAAIAASAAALAHATAIRADGFIGCPANTPLLANGSCGTFSASSSGSPARVELFEYYNGLLNQQQVPAFNGSIHAYADLNLGTLGVASSRSGSSGATTAAARLQETIQFSIAGATNSTVTPIDFMFGFDGTLGVGSVLYQADFFSNNFAFVQVHRGYLQDGGGNVVMTNNLMGGIVTESSPDQFSGRINLVGSNPWISLTYQLSVADNATFDRTARFAFSALPSNVTWTSDSGQFLVNATPPTTTVPEPATLGLMLAGVGALAIVRRRSTQPDDVPRSLDAPQAPR